MWITLAASSTIEKNLSWYTSAFTAWLHHTRHHAANQDHPALVGPICDPPRLANSTFLAQRLTMGSEVSPSMDQLSGTAYLLNFDHLTSRWTSLKPDWRHFCLTADFAHLLYFTLILCCTNVLNNNTDNNKVFDTQRRWHVYKTTVQ